MRMHLLGWLLLGNPAMLGAAPLDPCLPADATLVLAVHVRQVAAAPLTRQLFPQGLAAYLPELPSLLRELPQTLALDLTRDVDSLLLAGTAPPRWDQGVLVLRGKFDVPQAQAAARAWAAKNPDRFQIIPAGNRLLYQWKDASAPAGCFLDQGTFVLAPARAQVEECIARYDGRKQAQVRPEMKALLEKVDAQQSVWLVVLATDELRRAFGGTPETEKLFAALQSFSGGATVGDGFAMAGSLLTQDAKAADDMRKFAEGLKAILSLAAADSKDSPTLRAAVIAAVKVGTAGPAVTLRGSITREQLDKLPRLP